MSSTAHDGPSRAQPCTRAQIRPDGWPMTGERRSGRGALTAVSVAVLTGVLVAGCAQQPAASTAAAGHERAAQMSTARLAAAVGPSQPAGTQLRLETLLSH